jgi:hypothetical protein
LDPESEWFERATPEALRKVTVLSVDPDSPAEDAGLRRGDVIHAVDGSAVRTPQDVVSAVASAEPGDELTMTIRRLNEESQGGDELEIPVTLAEHPEERERPYLGVRLGFLGIRLRRFGGHLDPERWREEYAQPDRWELPFHLPELPDHWELPFDLEDLPHQFHFEWPRGDDTEHREFIPGGDSV